MRAPSLTPREVAAVLYGNVERLVALEIDREAAIRAVALDHGVSPDRVQELVASYCPSEGMKEASRV
jgi:hypothetical protein